MTDPHVVSLHYRFQSSREHDRFDQADELTGSLGRFDYALAEGMLIARPQEHYPDREAARDAIEPLLRAWELRAFLSDRDHRIRFDYDHAEIVDRDPTPGHLSAYAANSIWVRTAANATVRRDNRAYPSPDLNFVTTPITEKLAERVRRVRDGEAEPPAAAYYVLTALENEFGGGGRKRRRATAQRLRVDLEVLDKLGELTARHDPDIGRKAQGVPAPLTGAEVNWIRAAMLRLVLRTGEAAGTALLAQITMKDLPAL